MLKRLIYILSIVLIVSLLFGLSYRVSIKPNSDIISISSIRAQELSVGDSSTILYDRIHYTDSQGQEQYVDNSWQAIPAPWNWGMTHDDYHVRVKTDITQGQVIEFSNGDSVITFQPLNLQWSNDLSQIQPIAIPNNVTAIVGNKPTELIPGIENNEGYIRWNNAYGSGLNFKWQCTPGTLEKAFEISDLSNLPTPEQYIIDGGNACLELQLVFDPTSDLTILVDGQPWNKRTQVQTFDFIQFYSGEEEVWSFKPLRYWCSDDGTMDGESIATLDKKGNSLFIGVRVPYDWLLGAVYPVYIDADVTIESAAYTALHGYSIDRGGPFWKSTTVGYVVYLDNGADLIYRKTSDGGASWGGQNEIVGTSNMYVDCFADWQVDGDAGTKIHIIYFDKTNNQVMYIYLDTSDDSIGGSDVIEACQGSGTFASASGLSYGFASICKSRGGNICAALRYQDNAATPFESFYTSADADTWVSSDSLWETNIYDVIELYPGNEADNQDIWAAFWDYDASEISLKTYDDSGDSWSEQSISSSMSMSTSYMNMGGQVRISDGHLFLAAWNLYDNAAADLKVWDINGAASITARTNIITDESESVKASVFVNQVNGDIYVEYISGTTWTSVVSVFYQKSVNNGVNWGGETAMQANEEDDERWISAGCMKAAWGGLFEPIWFNDDLDDIFCNTDNAVTITAAVGGPEITNTQDTLGFGILAVNTTSNTAINWSTIENTGTGAVDVTIQGTDLTGGGDTWDLDDAGTPWVNIYALKAGLDDDDDNFDVIVKEDAAYNELINNLLEDATQDWGIKIYMPTSVTDYEGQQMTATVTLVASAH